MNGNEYPIRVGDLRPSQLLWAFGPGSLVDLPQLSTVVMGLDDWRTEYSVPITEARLLQAVREILGPQVELMRAAPLRSDPSAPFKPFTPEASIGVPVTTFPRWLRCPLCSLLAEYDSGLFSLRPHPYRPDRVKYVHSNCAKRNEPTAVPARFLSACRGGHLDDFPWHWFVHRGPSECSGQLRFYEQGASLQTENLWVECSSCPSKRPMSEAFGEQGRTALPACRARHPHLVTHDGTCSERLRTVLLGASNSWFPVTKSVLGIPTKVGNLEQLIADKWELLKGIPSREVLPHVIGPLADAGQLPGIREYSEDEIWANIEQKLGGAEDHDVAEGETDLKIPEWDIFVNPDPKSDWPDFMVRPIAAPEELRNYFSSVVLVERLREVNALIGFTRVEPPEEGFEGGEPPPRAPISRATPTWVPATEVRGEGIFIRFDSLKLRDWLSKDEVQDRANVLLAGHRGWRTARHLQPPDARFPGIVHILLHTFSHVVLRELALECGYNAASIRERIYASGHNEEPEMAGVLLYTAAPDSDGTLGGLVELGKPENLGRLIDLALSHVELCSADPLCAEHLPSRDATLHGTACHACTFVPETSCEIGNRYLDRALIVPTVDSTKVAFFDR